MIPHDFRMSEHHLLCIKCHDMKQAAAKCHGWNHFSFFRSYFVLIIIFHQRINVPCLPINPPQKSIRLMLTACFVIIGWTFWCWSDTMIGYTHTLPYILIFRKYSETLTCDLCDKEHLGTPRENEKIWCLIFKKALRNNVFYITLSLPVKIIYLENLMLKTMNCAMKTVA